jgi:acetylornithine deacetylase/succinyl-diaminopimelate desuccinylase-like protein
MHLGRRKPMNFINSRARSARVWSACFLLWVTSAAIAADAPPWQAVEAEALSLLSRYIQIDTTNPPGNEIEAARFFKRLFDREGIEATIIESAPGRGNIYARLRGNGTKKAVVLLNHMDVVPAEPKLWKEPPFSGVTKDGYLWGRGAWDMKSAAILELMAILVLKRSNVRLSSDVIFLATADEEAGGALGAGFLVNRHAELFKDVGLVLNEGGGIRVGNDGRVREYTVSVAEKTPLWLRLTASGTPGHGSTPSGNMAVHKLVSALHRLTQHQTPIKVIPEVQKFYADTAHLETPELAERYRDLRRALEDPAFAAEFTKNPRNNASVRNTLAITGLRGSDKINVIGTHAVAEIDVRLLPGEDPQVFIEQLRRLIADASIRIDVLLSFPAATSPAHPEALRLITELAQAHDRAPVVSRLVRGFTDCHHFREKGMPCLGFIPRRSTQGTESGAHGIDERMPVEDFKLALRAMYELVHRLAAD